MDRKKLYLDLHFTVIASVKELKRRLDSPQSLELSWPSVLTAEKNELLTNIAKSRAAEDEKHWEVASQELQNCLGILITHKSSIPQELMLWLVKRICVPLAFISQFRSQRDDFHGREQELETAYKAMRFMFQIVRDEYDYGEKGPSGDQVSLRRLVEAMTFSVPYEYAKLRAQVDRSRLRYELDMSSELYEQSNWLSTQYDLKGRCCEVMCVQYYKLGQLGMVYNWLDEWKRSIECIAERGTERLLQERDCMILEAMLFTEHGDDKKRAGKWITDLENLYQELTREGNNGERLWYILSVMRDIHSNFLPEDRLALQFAQDRMSLLLSTPDDDKNLQRACDSASSDEGVLEDVEKLIEHVQSELFIPNYFPSSLAKVLSDFRFVQAMYLRGSSGNYLVDLEKKIQLLDEALETAKKAGADVYYVVNVQSSLAHKHLTKALVLSGQLLRPEAWPLPEEQITPEFLDSNKYHTIGKVQDYLDRNGTSPTKAFRLSHHHYQQCAQLFTKHLDSLEYYSDAWIDAIEKQKKLYVNLQNLISVTVGFDQELYDMLSKLKNRPTEEVARCKDEYWEIRGNGFVEALLWSERGRARFLEQQLDQREQQPEIFPESRNKDLLAFYSDDQVAWNAIRSSLDACGEGTAFLEYFFEDEGDFVTSASRSGRVYGVHMVSYNMLTGIALPSCQSTLSRLMTLKKSDRIMEPCLMDDLNGDPVELQSLIEHLNKAMDPESQLGSQSEYDEEVRGDLEKLYKLLITPEVARFLKSMKHTDHKLVICPSQVFTKVPFAALRNPAEQCINKGYMFQSHTISITPSLRVLKHNMERYTALQEMKLMEGKGASVAMGDPCYENEDRRLKKSGAEVEAIASLFPNRCELLERRDATVANLLNSAKLPSERSGSQAFVHIAAHCEMDDADKKQGVLCLTEQDLTDIPSSSSTPPVNFSGILSAKNVVEKKIEWRSHMIVLSACDSGKGEIKAEGVLNLARAFMVAGVPCSVVSQWKVEDDSTAQLMTLFYQNMLQGLDVATALRSSMQAMLDDGFSIRQWAPFMVWGLPTVSLPDELLSEDAGIGLLRRGEELIHSYRYSDATVPLKKSLKLLKAKKSPPSDDLVRCLSWLADCEEYNYQLAQLKEQECYSYAVRHYNFKYVTMLRLDEIKADECRHLTSAVGYLDEALKYARNGVLRERSESLNTELDFWKRKWTLFRGSGIDIVVEYNLSLSDSSPHQVLHFCVRSQVHLPRHLAIKVDLNRLETASMMSAHSNPESGSCLTELEYLHEILIKPLLEDSLISATHHQTLVFIPCKLLEGVPFALLRDGAQPDGEGYLIQTHTVSIVPSFEILIYCTIQVLYNRTLLSMPDPSDASLVLCNPAISQEEMETGDSGGPAFTVASLFPYHCRALHGADSTVESLQIWATLPSSYSEEYCQAFFHIEAEIGEGFADELEKYGPSQWSACFAVARACPSANGQIQKEAMIRLVRNILLHGIPCVVMSNYPVFDVSSDVFFTHLYTNVKSGESVGAAVRHTMLKMKDVEGFDLAQWASFSVFGDPTVRLPEEMLGSPRDTRFDSDLPISPRAWNHLEAIRLGFSLKIEGVDLSSRGIAS